MSDTYDCNTTYTLSEEDPLDLHLAFLEFSSLTRERDDVVGAAFIRLGEVEAVEICVTAESERAALAKAESILGDVESSIRTRFGDSSIQRSNLEVRRQEPLPAETLDALNDAMELTRARFEAASAAAAEPSAPIPEPYELMRKVGTAGGNYDLDTPDIEAWFQAQAARERFHFIEIGGADVTIVFDELPEDVEAFAAEAYSFCPDLDNDVEALDDLDPDDHEELERIALAGIAENMRTEKMLRFWWD